MRALSLDLCRPSLSAILALALAGACGDSSVTTSTTDTDTAGTTGDESTGDATTTGVNTSTTGSGSGSTGTDTDPTNTDTDATTDTTGVMCEPMFEQGELCDMDCECLSDSCFTVPLIGGSCGECKVDADCPDGGCTIPNPWGMNGATCNMGEPGKGCETDEVCSDPDFPICATIIEAEDILALKTCSECQTNADCADPTPHCAAELDLDTFTGILTCMADGALANDEPCQHPGEADLACASGLCSLAVVQLVLDVGLCGECLDDADCMPGQTCTDAWVDLGANGIDGLHGSICE